MVPKITRGGSSFKGAFLYYLHDKGGAETRERVAWTQTENMRTDDPDQAWRVMAYTAREQDRLKEASGQSRAGRKLEKPVFAYSLSWHPEQEPSQEHMLETARQSLEMLGLSDHEAVIIAHQDEPQKHVHVIVNRVHPITGVAGDVRNTKRKFSDFAREYEREHGKIYCEQREKNYQKRQEGKLTRYHDQVIAEAWEVSRNGEDFVLALEKAGYTLARGRKRLVVVDPHGKIHNPVRHLEGVKAREFNKFVSDLDPEKLPEAGKVPIKTTKRAEDQDNRPELPDESQKEAFEELAAIQINALQDKHLNERDLLIIDHSRKLSAGKKELVARYRLKEQKRNISTLAARVKHASWWKRLIGVTKKDKQRLRERVMEYKDAYRRCKETFDRIKIERERKLNELRVRQEKERMQLKLQIDNQRATGNYTIARTLRKRVQTRTTTRSRGVEHGR